MSHPLRVRGLKLRFHLLKLTRQLGRTLYGCVD